MAVVLRAKGYGHKSAGGAAAVAGIPVKIGADHDDLEDPVISWGLRSGRCSVNKLSGLRVSQDKSLARTLMFASGVPVPTVIGAEQMISGSCPLPVVARPLRHTKGRDFLIITSHGGCAGHAITSGETHYYAELFHKDSEIRVHVAYGKVLYAQDKHYDPESGDVRANQAVTKKPWTSIQWSVLEQKPHHNAMRAALSAVDALGLDFGAVDVMLHGEVPCVCEVNSAPSLTEYGQEKYGLFFGWLERNWKPEKWDWKAKKNARSLIWKRHQLEA